MRNYTVDIVEQEDYNALLEEEQQRQQEEQQRQEDELAYTDYYNSLVYGEEDCFI